MTLDYALFLALIQGITEFLPISSSAHLILPSILFSMPDQGLAFDVAVHLGSLGAVCLALRQPLRRVICGVLCGWGSRYPQHARIGWMLVIATLPAVCLGFLLKGLIEGALRADWVIATTTLVFGLLLWWAHHQRGHRGLGSIRIVDALILGFAQALALIPGTSRSGITLTAGLWLGLRRKSAAIFSFLMSIPIILGASLIKTVDLTQSTEPVAWDAIAVGIVVSFIAAYACIRLFLHWIERLGLMPFVIYRLGLGLFLWGVIVLT